MLQSILLGKNCGLFTDLQEEKGKGVERALRGRTAVW
jgi:hypothetical protein